jgi:superfamily II DNA or RNA helicase
MSWKGTLVQYTGKVHRLHPRKSEVRIFDYVDCDVRVLLRMIKRRLRAYRTIRYAHGETPLGYLQPRDEPSLKARGAKSGPSEIETLGLR